MKSSNWEWKEGGREGGEWNEREIQDLLYVYHH